MYSEGHSVPSDFISSPGLKGQVSFSHHFGSAVHPYIVSAQLQKILSSSANFHKTLLECSLDGPLSKLCSITPPSNLIGCQDKNKKKGGWNFEIFSSETIWTILPKLYWNGPWVVPFQNYVRWPRSLTNMAARLKIEKKGDEFQKSSPLNYCSNFNQT